MSGSLDLSPEPLTASAFADFGDVIEAGSQAPTQLTGSGSRFQPMNEAKFSRFNALATTQISKSAQVIISIARCEVASVLPLTVSILERHPAGSQAFVPTSQFQFVVVVAPPGDQPRVKDIRAFVTNGHQGINYHRGVWHMPLVAFRVGHEFIVVDSNETQNNCDEFCLHELVTLLPY